MEIYMAKFKLDYNIIISLITFLFTIGMTYQKYLQMQEDIDNYSKKIVYLENKCKDFEIEYNKISTETKYIAINTEDIKKLIIRHIEADK
jgi:uncharacterized protein YktA (UPF0223 family)